MPQAPFRALQSADRLGADLCVDRAKTAPRPRAVCSACSKRTAICHQSSTTVAFGRASRCNRQRPASPSLSTVAGVSAVTPAAASAWLNASDAIAGELRAKAKRDGFPSASMILPAITSKCRSSWRCRLRTYPPSRPTMTGLADVAVAVSDFAACGCATALPACIVLFRTVLAFGAPLTGSNSDSRSATLPNGASAAYRAVT
jgi:hypothetical protein